MCENCINKFKGKVGQCATEVARFYRISTQSLHKFNLASAIELSKTALARLNLAF